MSSLVRNIYVSTTGTPKTRNDVRKSRNKTRNRCCAKTLVEETVYHPVRLDEVVFYKNESFFFLTHTEN